MTTWTNYQLKIIPKNQDFVEEKNKEEDVRKFVNLSLAYFCHENEMNLKKNNLDSINKNKINSRTFFFQLRNNVNKTWQIKQIIEEKEEKEEYKTQLLYF